MLLVNGKPNQYHVAIFYLEIADVIVLQSLSSLSPLYFKSPFHINIQNVGGEGIGMAVFMVRTTSD